MKLNQIESNLAEVEIGDVTVAFSFGTPVCAFEKGKGAFVTAEYFSASTTKHVNLMLKRWGATPEKTRKIRQADLVSIAIERAATRSWAAYYV